MNYLEAKAHSMTLLFDTDLAAELVTYNGGATQIPAVFDFSNIPGVSGFGGYAYVMMSDVATPQYRDTLLRGGVTWHVYRDDKTGDVAVEMSGMWQLKIASQERFGKWKR